MLAADIAADVFDRMREVIYETFWEKREGAAAVADALRGEFAQLSSSRALTIARTETTVVTGQAQHETLRRDGVQQKRWSAAVGNPNPPRTSHANTHGQVVPLDEPFLVGPDDDGVVEEMDHPGDPKASPGNVINCRCTEVAVVTGPLRVEDFWDGS